MSESGVGPNSSALPPRSLFRNRCPNMPRVAKLKMMSQPKHTFVVAIEFSYASIKIQDSHCTFFTVTILLQKPTNT